MKKINPEDLNLQIRNLSSPDSASGSSDAWETNPAVCDTVDDCNKTKNDKCAYTDVEEDCQKTMNTKCYCGTQSENCLTQVCGSASAGPICCPHTQQGNECVIYTKICESKDYCAITEDFRDCPVSGDCITIRDTECIC